MAPPLTRSTGDAMVGGVCSGLGAHLGIDTHLVRILFVILAVAPGIGVPLYLVLWLVLPEESGTSSSSSDQGVRHASEDAARRSRAAPCESRGRTLPTHSVSLLIGTLLLALGTAFLLRNLGVAWVQWITSEWVWPMLIILLGLVFLMRWIRDPNRSRR